YFLLNLKPIQHESLFEAAMGDAEKKVYVSLISVLLVTLAYGVITTVTFGPGFFLSNDTALAGKSILLLMVACAVVNILLSNSLTIFLALKQPVNAESNCEPVVDERDK